MKNSSDTIGNRTRDHPTCSAVPQPTALRRAPRYSRTLSLILAQDGIGWSVPHPCHFTPMAGLDRCGKFRSPDCPARRKSLYGPLYVLRLHKWWIDWKTCSFQEHFIYDLWHTIYLRQTEIDFTLLPFHVLLS